jgi:hypothetical protein
MLFSLYIYKNKIAFIAECKELVPLVTICRDDKMLIALPDRFLLSSAAGTIAPDTRSDEKVQRTEEGLSKGLAKRWANLIRMP